MVTVGAVQSDRVYLDAGSRRTLPAGVVGTLEVFPTNIE